MGEIRVQMPGLHSGQRRVAQDDARFRVLACGRRWGKTRLGSALCLETGLNGGRAWWVAPSYPVSSVGWRLVRRLAAQVPGTEIRQVERIATLPGGGTVQVRSADNPDSLRGEGLDFLVMDECAFIKEAAWSEALRPSLSDREGRALFISTPKGRNWFWREYQKGLASEPGYSSWRFETSDNPYIPPDEIEAARYSLPDRIFRQEYLAEFIDDAGGVFLGVMAAATAERAEYDPEHSYVMGADWGKHNDFTVISVIDATAGAMVEMERFNQIDYTLQVGRLQALHARYPGASIIAERNAMGDPLVEQLLSLGLPVSPFTTTNASKKSAVEALALAIERGDLRVLPDPILVGELQAFEAKRLPSGMLRYEAPDGMHDDTVISLALAWYGVGTGWLIL